MARTNKYTKRRKNGIVTPYGQWLYPGQVTTIPGNNITMQGVPYPVLGVSDKGDVKMMMPGMDYLFKGNEVTEYPVMQRGGFGRKRVEKNGMEYLKDTDGYTGVVQKQTQHGLGLSRRYDAPVYQYYDNGTPVGDSWRGASGFQNDIVKDYESEPVVPFSRKYSNYDPNLLTFFKDLATGETPFKPYEMPLDRSLLNPSIGNGISQSFNANSFPIYIPPATSPVSAVPATTNNVPGNSNRNRFDQWNDYREKYWYGKMSGEADMNKNSYTSEYKRDANGNTENFTTIGFGNTGIPYGTTWDYNTAIEKSFDSWNDHIQLAKQYYNNMRKEHQDWPEWNALPQFTQDLFGHYNYGVRNGITGFPKFVGAMATGDYDTALKEYTIKNNKKRNDYVGGWLNFMLGNTDVYPEPMNKSNMREGYNYQNGGRIYIKDANRGKFTEAAQRAGKSVQAYAAQILANKENYSPTLVKRANFARNAAKWKHQEGGDVIRKYLEGNYLQPKTVDSVMGVWNDMLAKNLSKGEDIANWIGAGLQAAATASSAVATQFGKDFTKDIMAGQRNKQTSVAAPKSEVKFDLDEDLLKVSQEMEAADYTEEPIIGIPEMKRSALYQYQHQQVPMTAPRPNVDTNKQWFFDPRQINVEFGNYHINPNNTDIIDYYTWLRKSKERREQGENSMLYNTSKFAAGGKLAPNAEIEYGEIAETEGGAEQANGNTVYHISMTDKNETTRNQVTFTNNVHEDVKNNPQLTKLPVRENKYTSARRKGIPYVQVGGMIKQVPFYNEYALVNGTDGKKKTFLYPSTTTTGGRITEPVDRTHYPLAEYINQKFLS